MVAISVCRERPILRLECQSLRNSYVKTWNSSKRLQEETDMAWKITRRSLSTAVSPRRKTKFVLFFLTGFNGLPIIHKKNVETAGSPG